MQRNTPDFDLVVIGGGINGCGIARDAQGRGLATLLVEQDDLASHTSSASTKLIHGGLRYLEQYEFSLVRKALQEREILLDAAPHITRALRFVMPYDPGMRPLWLIRLGMWLYDHLAARRRLAGSICIDLRNHPAGGPLGKQYARGFEYSDGWVDDARLVALNAVDAVERGAQLRTRCIAQAARRHAGYWEVDLYDQIQQMHSTVSTRSLVNATGPWVGLMHDHLGVRAHHRIRLVKGSHIVVRKLFDHPYAYIFQNPDKRIVFAIPYERDYTLIGTTDVDYRGDLAKLTISSEETDYLCDMVDRYFSTKITSADVIHSYAGVRPLVQEADKAASEVTRDYLLELDAVEAPLLSVFGGKITTYRRLAEEAVDTLQKSLGQTPTPWTAPAKLPGGDLPVATAIDYAEHLRNLYPWLPITLAQRYASSYGTRALRILDGAADTTTLGEQIAPDVFEAELRYLCDVEWARAGADILWRRSKLGLHLAADEHSAINDWTQRYLATRDSQSADSSTPS
jgi:glycerol-3-phosphate dehydrogenase